MTVQLATVLNGNILSAKSCAFFIDLIPRGGIVAHRKRRGVGPPALMIETSLRLAGNGYQDGDTGEALL